MRTFTIYERSRCQSAERAVERGYSFTISGRLYDAVKECIVSQDYFDIPEVFTSETWQIIQPVGFVSATWRYCTNENAFENGWIPGGYGGVYRRLDGKSLQFLTSFEGLLVLREYEVGCSMGKFEHEEFISKKDLLAMPEPPEEWMIDSVLGL